MREKKNIHNAFLILYNLKFKAMHLIWVSEQIQFFLLFYNMGYVLPLYFIELYWLLKLKSQVSYIKLCNFKPVSLGI